MEDNQDLSRGLRTSRNARLGLQACLEWRLLSLLLPLQTVGYKPSGVSREYTRETMVTHCTYIQVSRYRPSLKPCNDIRIRKVLF